MLGKSERFQANPLPIRSKFVIEKTLPVTTSYKAGKPALFQYIGEIHDEK